MTHENVRESKRAYQKAYYVAHREEARISRENMKPNCKCYICGKGVYRIPSRLSDHSVCSTACRNKYFSGQRSFVWKGGAEAHKERKQSLKGRQAERQRIADRKIKAVEMLGGKCSACGYDRCPAALEFHHRDPLTKDLGIKQLYCCSWVRLEKELEKCILLCANCHREHHWNEKNGEER